MIEFLYKDDFRLEAETEVANWIRNTIEHFGCEEGEITFTFVDDDTLYAMNVEYLGHDTYTDIISFDYSLGNEIHGEVFISIDRVRENAATYEVSFEDELHRVIIHGILHYCGLKDKTEAESNQMRSAENAALLNRKFI
jgi:rRNA maturation RNase YbeY